MKSQILITIIFVIFLSSFFKAELSQFSIRAEVELLSQDSITDAEFEEALDRTLDFYYNSDEPSPFVHRSEKITEDLLHRLLDVNSVEAGSSAVLLAERGDPRGIYVMLGHSHRSRNESYPVGNWSMQSLGGTGCKEGVPILLEVLENENDPEIVRVLCDALIGSGEKSSDIVDALIKKYKEIKDAEIIRDIGYLKAKDAMPFVIKCLASEDRDTPSTAIYAIAEIGGKEAMALLIKILHEQDENKRKAVALSLSEIDITGFEKELIPFLNDFDLFVRNQITFALAKTGNERAILQAINIYENNENFNSQLELLGEIRDKRAIPVLIKNINNENPYIAQDAIIAVGKLNGKEALPKLTKIINSTNLFETRNVVKNRRLFISAARTCLQLGDNSVIQQIINNLEKVPKDLFMKAYATSSVERLIEDIFYKGSYPNGESIFIDDAILLLADSKNKQATDYLESKGVKVSLLAPKSIEVNTAIKELRASFDSASPTVRALAAKQAGVLGRIELVDGLEKLLEDEYYNVRDCAALSLGALKSEKSIPKLRAVKQDKMTRATVEKALKMINSPADTSQ